MKPRRPLVLTIEIGGENIEDIRAQMRSIDYELAVHIDADDFQKPSHTCVWGGNSTGGHWTIEDTETKDNDEYFRQLDEWLANKEEDT